MITTLRLLGKALVVVYIAFVATLITRSALEIYGLPTIAQTDVGQ